MKDKDRVLSRNDTRELNSGQKDQGQRHEDKEGTESRVEPDKQEKPSPPGVGKVSVSSAKRVLCLR